MSFQVTKLTKVMVPPAGPTPSENLELSAIDRVPGLNARVRSFHIYEHGREPAKVIREALGKALVHYYPFAGRLTRSSGELQVACTGEGVWFIEAKCDRSLGEITTPEVPLHGDLLPDPAPGEDPDNAIMLMQVTEFNCGGFIIGLENSHCISDGLGTAQFLAALAELAGGLSSPSTPPIWRPSAIPRPKPRPFSLPPAAPPTFDLRRATLDIPLQKLNLFKSRFLSATSQRCSVFEALAAGLWQSRARAILKTHQFAQFKLVFMANARPLVRPPLPAGFCSNCFFPVSVSGAGGWLAAAPPAEVVARIKEAKARLPEDFGRWAEGGGEEDPYFPAVGYGTLFLSEWARLGFEKVDFGWGPPTEIVPLTYSDLIPVCVVGSPPAPATGARLSTQCVEEEHVGDFVGYLKGYWDLGEGEGETGKES